jgi:phosphoglucomutase
MPEAVVTVATAPIAGQKPGTSGLRKKTREFMKENYVANFVQSTFTALKETPGGSDLVSGGTLVVSGDGRFYNPEAIQIIIKIAAANGVGRVWCGCNGILSTPGVSAVIRARGKGSEAFGGFILTASHNPGGIDEDFGIKYNCENGGPAPESLTDLIYKHTTSITSIQSCAGLADVDLSKPGVTSFDGFSVEVFDSTVDHVGVLTKCFDLAAIKALVSRPDFTVCYDAMHGVNGPYARAVFIDTLGCKEEVLQNCVPKPDFGGPNSASHGHADPNLKNAVELCARMKVGPTGDALPGSEGAPTLGAAADGDGDRNMILGPGFFVTPSDSLAVIVDQCAEGCVPQFKAGVGGAARSMPTSGALDIVCKARNIPLFETPTGWKFFGNLMDSGKYSPFICGEESFGTGSDHVREKDGMWAVLAWLQILAAKNPDSSRPLVTVPDIVRAHWAKYGRNYYARHDYEGVETKSANDVMSSMIAKQGKWPEGAFAPFELETQDVFEYKDPVDGSVTGNQGVRFMLKGGSRIIFRLSGTGVSGATIRVYLEKFEPPSGDLSLNAISVVEPLGLLARSLSDMQNLTGREGPSVIT